MQTADEIARELERAIAEATAKVETFIAAQSGAFTQAQHEHDGVMRDMEGAARREARARPWRVLRSLYPLPQPRSSA